MKYYAWFSSFFAFTVSMSKQAVLDCSHSGDCEEDCKWWAHRMRRQLSKISMQNKRGELKDTGGWDDLDEVGEDVIDSRLVWIVACDLKEREGI